MHIGKEQKCVQFWYMLIAWRSTLALNKSAVFPRGRVGERGLLQEHRLCWQGRSLVATWLWQNWRGQERQSSWVLEGSQEVFYSWRLCLPMWRRMRWSRLSCTSLFTCSRALVEWNGVTSDSCNRNDNHRQGSHRLAFVCPFVAELDV